MSKKIAHSRVSAKQDNGTARYPKRARKKKLKHSRVSEKRDNTTSDTREKKLGHCRQRARNEKNRWYFDFKQLRLYEHIELSHKFILVVCL